MGSKYKMHGWQANKKTHLCVASNIRVIPENEKPPAMRVDIYFLFCGDVLYSVQNVGGGIGVFLYGVTGTASC